MYDLMVFVVTTFLVRSDVVLAREVAKRIRIHSLCREPGAL